MKSYLTKTFDWQTQRVADVYDEMPLWTANFGQLLLENFPIKAYKQVLDIGFGTGFPLIEIAQRLGSDCRVIGIDPWKAAGNRAKEKIEVFELKNIEIIEADASNLLFEERSIDLIVSNLGINNFENPQQVLNECYRVLKPGGLLCTTSNLTGTFKEFFAIFERTIAETGYEKYLPALKEHIAHRGSKASVCEKMENAGFKINRTVSDSFSMRFYDGTAFLNYAFVILGFLAPWKNIFEKEDILPFFEIFEKNLNEYAAEKGELKLTVPMMYFEGMKS